MANNMQVLTEPLSEIQCTFANSTILVTGATGFVGKMLVEKLLRACPYLKKIYVIMRTKKGKSIQERFEELMRSEVFANTHTYNENYKDQVVALEGDVELDNLGLSAADRLMLTKEVNFLIHCAASVRFDAPLRSAAMSNVKSTREMIKLAKEVKNLKCFTHVSTAYSFCHKKVVQEKIYEVPYTPGEFMKMIDELSDEELDQKTPEILKGWLNTYVFTKAIAEHAVLLEASGLPRVIARPAVIVSAAVEPAKGWIDTFNGPITAVMLSGLGIIHSVYAHPKSITNYVPADYVVSHILSCTNDAIKMRNKKIKNSDVTNLENDVPVYTLSSSTRNPLRTDSMIDFITRLRECLPLENSVAYGWVIPIPQYWLFFLVHTIFHVIPAYLADFVFTCIGKKTMAVKGVKKFHKLSVLLSDFALYTYILSDENTQKMVERMSHKDRRLFNCDIDTVNWPEFAFNACMGGKKFTLKEKMGIKDFEAANKKRILLGVVHYTILSFLAYILYKFTCSLFN